MSIRDFFPWQAAGCIFCTVCGRDVTQSDCEHTRLQVKRCGEERLKGTYCPVPTSSHERVRKGHPGPTMTELFALVLLAALLYLLAALR